YVEHKIRRYGFHGTSHKYVASVAADFVGKNINELKIISCHVGNGASITAINGGDSVDTSMGLTPLEGLVMGTRCGDIDPAIPIYLQENLNMTSAEVNTLLNKKSGMLGLSQLSNDMRTIEDGIIKEHDHRAIRAHDVYAYRIKKYIGAYAAAMNGVDIIIFTGGVGENMPILREIVCSDMEYMGVKIDKKENNQWVGGTLDISAEDSKVKVLKVQTNEELMIAIETEKIIKSLPKE
ncbi:MAG: acetate kinase, partial [Candidatus Cloacimonetes bacterium 4572_65]